MRRFAVVPILLVIVVISASCVDPGGGAPSSTTAVALVTPTPSSSPTPSPSPSPSPLSSAKGTITVKAPLANARLSSPFSVSGDASVFEAALQWRLTDTAGRILASGSTTASLGAPGRGTYSVTVSYFGNGADTIAFVEVFSRSPKDGEIDEIVRVPVTLR